ADRRTRARRTARRPRARGFLERVLTADSIAAVLGPSSSRPSLAVHLHRGRCEADERVVVPAEVHRCGLVFEDHLRAELLAWAAAAGGRAHAGQAQRDERAEAFFELADGLLDALERLWVVLGSGHAGARF